MTENMIKLALFDIDGTLYDEKNRAYPASAVKALKKLHDNGILVAAATGRPPFTAAALRQVGIPLDYLVCSNGHLVLDGGGTVLESKVFPPEMSQEVWDYCRKHRIGLLWKYPDCTYVYRNDPEFDKIFAKGAKKASGVFYDNQRVHLSRFPNGGCLACGPETLEDFNCQFAGRCRGVDINGRSSDLILWNVDKRYGVELLLDRLGIGREECIAFGDNRNDMEIIRYVGIGVAMGNGEEELKRVSSYVTAAVDDDGIRKGLEHFGLI